MNYKFTAVNVGEYGSCSDREAFVDLVLDIALREGSLNIPEDKPLPQTCKPLPHVMVGSVSFPFAGKITYVNVHPTCSLLLQDCFLRCVKMSMAQSLSFFISK